ncbi:MAG TPA: hypothetical protein DCZ94_05845 [Lentisphaeria bacterium]|nr:hypothetical protein [Lentisphaeria bacterium]
MSTASASCSSTSTYPCARDGYLEEHYHGEEIRASCPLLYFNRIARYHPGLRIIFYSENRQQGKGYS